MFKNTLQKEKYAGHEKSLYLRLKYAGYHQFERRDVFQIV